MRLVMVRVLFCLGLPLAAVPGSAQVVVAGGSTGGGSPFSPPAAQIYSYFDHAGISGVTSQIEDFLALNETLPGSVPPLQLTTAAALQNLKGMLGGPRNRAFMQAASTAPELRSPTALGMAAMVYLARGQSAEALALLLVAGEKMPVDPAARLNLVAAALAYRRANEALPLLDEVERSGNVPIGAMGIPGDVLVAYLRGYAFMLRGEYRKAKPLLVRVVGAEPNLKEAALTLALVEAKLGEDPRKAYLQGVWRQRGKLIVRDRDDPETEGEATREADPFSEGEDIAPSMDDLLDLSRGKPGTLMEVRRPVTAAELLAVAESYPEAMAAALQTAAELHNNVAGSALQAFLDAQLPEAYKLRMSNLYDKATVRVGAAASLDQAVRERDFYGEQFQERTEEAIDAAMEAREPIMARWAEFMNQPGNNTPANTRRMNAELNATTDAALASVRTALQQYHAAIDREYAIRSAYMTGMLGHIGEPNLRVALTAEAEAVRHEMEGQKLAAVTGLLPAIGAFEPEPRAGMEEGSDGEGPACHDDDGKASVSLDALVADVEFTCTSVSLEFQLQVVPLLGVSAEVGADVNGTVSAFLGPKVDGKVWAFKNGLYVTAGKDGIRDAGIKAEMKGSTGFGPVRLNHKLDETVVSFLPAPDPGPPAGALPVFKQ